MIRLIMQMAKIIITIIIKEIITFSIYCTTLWQKSFQIIFSLIDIARTIQIQEKLTFIIQTPVDMMKEKFCYLNN